MACLWLEQIRNEAEPASTEQATGATPQAETERGEAYYSGAGVETNYPLAFAYFSSAAAQGFAPAERELAAMYENGLGVAPSQAKAFEWYQKAADQYDAIALYKTGLLYINGTGVPKDEKKGFTCLLFSADAPYAPAQCAVAKCYESGTYVLKDPVQAYKWYLNASLISNSRDIEDSLNALAKQLSIDDIGKGMQLADNWAARGERGLQSSSFTPKYAQGSSATMPFEWWDDHIFLPVTLQNKQIIYLLVDTGSAFCWLDQAVAEQLGLRGNDYVSIEDAANKPILGQILENALSWDFPGLSLRGVSAGSASLAVMSEYEGRPVGGVLGMDLLQNFVIRLDYIHQTIEFIDPKSFSGEVPANAVTLEVKRLRPYVEAGIADRTDGFATGNFLVDTGGGTISLSSGFISAHPQLDLRSRGKSNIGGAAGGFEATSALCHGLELGKSTLTDVPFFITSGDPVRANSSNAGGLMGNAIWERFDLVLDFPDKKLFLNPNANFDAPFKHNLYGFGLKTTGADLSQMVVCDLSPHSPAAQAGVKLGDVLLQVDATPTTSLNLDTVRHELQEPGTHAFVWQRAEGNVTLTLRAASDPPSDPSAPALAPAPAPSQ